MSEHSVENDVPRSSWLEAVIHAALADRTSDHAWLDEVSLHLTRALWPVIQADRSQVWEECAREAHDLGWLHNPALSDLIARDPYRVTPTSEGDADV
jgi:hypothetical protein